MISRHHGGSPSASIVTFPCLTRSSLRCGPLEDEDDGMAPGLGIAEHAQLGADRIGEHRHGDEATLVKLGPGDHQSPVSCTRLTFRSALTS